MGLLVGCPSKANPAFGASGSTGAGTTASGTTLGASTSTADPSTSSGSTGSGEDAGTTGPMPECTIDGDCSAGLRCHPQSRLCVECVDGTDCSGATPACDPQTLTCVECLDDGHCTDPGFPACKVNERVCVACTGSAYCNESERPSCDPETNMCFACVSDGDCGGAGTPNCDAQTGVCSQCVDDDDCVSGDCRPDNTCATEGFSCDGDSANCNDGQECCGDSNCDGACMVPCTQDDECPMPALQRCEHGYCLYMCSDNDSDCAAWPGFTCEHGGELCEYS